MLNDKDEVTYRHVEVGGLNDGLRVIQRGLKTGERVVLNGLQRVRPGMKVVAKDISMTAEDSTKPFQEPDSGPEKSPLESGLQRASKIAAVAGDSAVSPGAAPPVSTATTARAAASRDNAPQTATPKADLRPRPGVKSAAMF